MSMIGHFRRSSRRWNNSLIRARPLEEDDNRAYLQGANQGFALLVSLN